MVGFGRWCSGKRSESTWDDLLKVEKKRRAILLRNELPFYKILTYVDGTVVSLLLTDPLLWATMLAYGIIRLRMLFVPPWGWMSDVLEDVVSIGYIGTFLTFFLVFFVQHSYSRLNEQYFKVMVCKGRILDVAMMARARLPKDISSRLVRYMNAAHIATFVGLSNTYTSNNLFGPLNRQKMLLVDKELDRINSIGMETGSSAALELLTWVMMEVEDALSAELLDCRHACQFRDHVMQMKESILTVFDYKDHPIPFFYIHFLCLLSIIYLPLYSINAAFSLGTAHDSSWPKDLYTAFVVLLQAIFVIGLRVLGQKFADPFGSDLEDLSVMHYCNNTWKLSKRILLSPRPSPDPKTEAKLMVCDRESVGEAWAESRIERPISESSRHSIDSFLSVDQDVLPPQDEQSIVSKILRSWNQ
mmetsp:Transcript_37448/g.45740  ORF Transcript_37448/g.45740 Transcript_37448/m.45740 type:complete len:416 (-) Transcript_37448:224-1471(-)